MARRRTIIAEREAENNAQLWKSTQTEQPTPKPERKVLKLNFAKPPEEKYACDHCKREFKSKQGLTVHQRHCMKRE